MELTNKQKNALKNMEIFIGIKSNRTLFNNKNELDEYFELLQKKASKKAILLKQVENGNITFSEINKKKNIKILNYYNIEDNLKQYALKYIEKYFPTINKLRQKLLDKSKNEELVNIIIEKVRYLINEEKMINNIINFETVFGNKNINKLNQKLYNKKFPKKLIEEKINELNLNPESLVDEGVMENRIKKLINKGKSKKEIMCLLKERKQDEKIILSILDKEYEDNTQNNIIKKEIEKLTNKGNDNKKIIQKLLLKGFSYSDIKQNINI